MRTGQQLVEHRPQAPHVRALVDLVELAGWAALVAGAGCNYSFTAGQGFPDHVRTIAVVPFENETARFELTTEIFTALNGTGAEVRETTITRPNLESLFIKLTGKELRE